MMKEREYCVQVLDVAGGVDSGFINFRAKAQPDGTGILSGTFSANGENLLKTPYNLAISLPFAEMGGAEFPKHLWISFFCMSIARRMSSVQTACNGSCRMSL